MAVTSVPIEYSDSSDTANELSYTENGQFGPTRLITNVTKPTLTVIRPESGKKNGAAVLILPGGAFQVLAWDIEGTEVAKWFADRGVTAFILKYQVRKYTPEAGQSLDIASVLGSIAPAHSVGVRDAGLAVLKIRQDASAYGIDPGRVGMIGFSAGGSIAIGAALTNDVRVRPNYAAFIYPIWNVTKLTASKAAPSTFIVAAKDDLLASITSNEIAKVWTDAGASTELHLYEKGGHGFGMRKTGLPSDRWTSEFEEWLSLEGILP